MPGRQKQGTVFERINGEYYALTNAEKKTADYVMNHMDETQFLSIAELAEESGVAEATVSRFCRRLGYGGYNAFKLAIANDSAPRRSPGDALSGQIGPEDTLEDVLRKVQTADTAALNQTAELLRPEAVRAAADELERANKVLCMGLGGSMLIAEEAAHLFSPCGGKFFPVRDAHMQSMAAAMLEEGDAVLYFSYSGATRDMAETLRIVRERGAKVILVTRFPKSPGSALADVVLQCGSNESPLQLGSVAARIAQLYLLDVLFSELCRRDLDTCRESRRRIAAALTDKHL